MIDVSVEMPDAFGIIIIKFVLSREDATCTCRLDGNPPAPCKSDRVLN